MDLGLERAGFEVLWQVENNEFCNKVLAKHWPNVTRYGDVHDVGKHNLSPVDLICGGFPCQPVSVAGKRKGQDDERWLWPEFARIIRELRPRYALMENVPGLLTRGMGDVLGDLAEIGYDAEWGVLSACSMGAPHTRERLFIVADAHSKRIAQPQPQGWPSQVSDRAGFARSGDNAAIPWVALDAGGFRRRADDGFRDSVDRLAALGNAVLPQVAEYIGRRIMEAA